MSLIFQSVFISLFLNELIYTAISIRIVPIDSPDSTVSDGETQPLVKYASFYTDETGATHFKYCRFEGLSKQSFSPPALPQWVGELPEDVNSLSIGILPVNYVGTWHSAPGPQAVVTLSGAWSLEATDGQILIQRPGEWYFANDYDSKPRPNDTRVGHITRNADDVPCVQLILSFKNPIDYRCV